VWQPDTLAPPPGTLAGYSLALDPVTDQPVVAWAASDGVTNRLRIARRGASAWQTWQVDSSSIYIGHPSLALDATGRPRIAVVRWDGSQGPGVYCVEANVPAGPWTWSLASADVEPGGMFAPHASIALDPITAEPRIAWVSTAILGYASRTAGIWTSQTMGSGTWRAPPTLALDDAGRPRILVTDENPILAAGPAAVQACGGVVTHLLHLFDRATATGSGPFQESIIANHVEAYAHALAIGGPLTHLVWRDTEFNTCVPADMIHAVEGTVGVPFAVAAGRGALELSPMPMRHGGATSVTLRLDAPGRVALDVTDVAGRRMARHTLDASGGVTVLRWELGGLRAGVYQVTARRDGIRFGSATLVVR
jgi:hypothetical protein